MGRASIIWVLGFSILFGTTRTSVQRTMLDTMRNVVADYERMAARNIANTGVYIALQTVSQNNQWRSGFNDMSFSGGSYGVTVQDSTADPSLGSSRLRLIGTGQYGDASHTVRVVIEGENQMPPVPGAVAINSDSTTFSLAGNSFNIDGRDTNVNGTPGPGPDLWGLAVSNAGDSSRCVAQPRSNRILGSTSAPSVGVSTDLPDLEALAQWLRRRADYDLPTGSYNAVTWGTFASPAIVYIDGNGSIAGNSSGAGILVVNGNLKLAGTFSWQGLVIVFGTNLTVDTTVGTPNIYGALLVQADTAFLDVKGNVNIIYSSQTIENAQNKLDVHFYRLVSWWE